MAKRKKTPKPDIIELFVSPEGDDAWSGKRPQPNARKTDGPFATVSAAQKAIRKLKKKAPLDCPVRVCLRGGMYSLKAPLTFTPADSGEFTLQIRENVRQDHTVVYAAYQDETPVLSGGRRIEGWKAETLNGQKVWVARIPEVKRGRWNFHQLWVNGARRQRTRLPRGGGFFRIGKLARIVSHKGHPWSHGDDRFIYCEDNLSADWRNLQDVEVLVCNYWVDSRMAIQRIEPKKRRVIFDRKSRNNLLDDRPVDGKRIGACYWVENVFETLQDPGQWYLDRSEGKLYYLPMPGEDMDTAEVVAPRLEQVVRVEGTSLEGDPAAHIRFEGIAFSHTEWTLPEGVAASNQAANEAPAAISVQEAHDIRFERCAVEHVGAYGIECLDATRDVEIVGCRIADLGAGGIKVWHGCRRTLVSDNEIGDGGHIYHAGVGVLVGQSSANRIVHNHIHDFFYTGISVGWCWGYAEGHAYGNILEYNHIHDIGHGLLSDMGGIYLLSVAPGTRIRFNLIHDIWSRTYGGWGIYPDEGSSHLLVENNLAYNTKCGGFHQHYGRENLVRNNIFALARLNQLHRTRVEAHDSFTFEKNIIYFTEGAVWTGNWRENRAAIRNNLYFDPRRKRLDFGGMTFKQWQARGLDEGSLIADPGFVNPDKHDFRLKENSPAFKLGFVPFDLSGVGPRAEPQETV